MPDYTFKGVVFRAFCETREAVRLDSAMRITVALATSAIVAIGTWLVTGEPVVTGLFAVGALLLIGVVIFVTKLATVPFAMVTEAGERIEELEAEKAAFTDPDMIYQDGRAIGEVNGVNARPNEGWVRFGQISDPQGRLDRERPFQYRNWTLLLESAGANFAMYVQSGPMRSASITHNQVIARIM